MVSDEDADGASRGWTGHSLGTSSGESTGEASPVDASGPAPANPEFPPRRILSSAGSRRITGDSACRDPLTAMLANQAVMAIGANSGRGRTDPRSRRWPLRERRQLDAQMIGRLVFSRERPIRRSAAIRGVARRRAIGSLRQRHYRASWARLLIATSRVWPTDDGIKLFNPATALRTDSARPKPRSRTRGPH